MDVISKTNLKYAYVDFRNPLGSSFILYEDTGGGSDNFAMKGPYSSIISLSRLYVHVQL